MNADQWKKLSNDSQQTKLQTLLVEQKLPANRPQIVSVIIPITSVVTEKCTLLDLLRNYQLFSIVGFTNTGVQSRTTALAAKIFSIGGGTYDEKNYINEAVLQSPGFSTYGLVYSIIESTDIVITLAGGHGLQELHFYCLPAVYLNSNNIYDLKYPL